MSIPNFIIPYIFEFCNLPANTRNMISRIYRDIDIDINKFEKKISDKSKKLEELKKINDASLITKLKDIKTNILINKDKDLNEILEYYDITYYKKFKDLNKIKDFNNAYDIIKKMLEEISKLVNYIKLNPINIDINKYLFSDKINTEYSFINILKSKLLISRYFHGIDININLTKDFKTVEDILIKDFDTVDNNIKIVENNIKIITNNIKNVEKNINALLDIIKSYYTDYELIVVKNFIKTYDELLKNKIESIKKVVKTKKEEKEKREKEEADKKKYSNTFTANELPKYMEKYIEEFNKLPYYCKKIIIEFKENNDIGKLIDKFTNLKDERGEQLYGRQYSDNLLSEYVNTIKLLEKIKKENNL